MTQFATNAELGARMGLTLTAAEQTRADTLLALASGLIQQETGQTLTVVGGDTLTMRSVAGDRFRLPERPVTAIHSIAIDGVQLDPDAYYLDGDELVRAFFPVGIEQHFYGVTYGWLGPLHELTVVYTHGFATIPELVKAVCMEAVVRCWVNPGAVEAEQIGNVNVAYSRTVAPSGLLLTDFEKKALNDLLRRTQGSVTLR